MSTFKGDRYKLPKKYKPSYWNVDYGALDEHKKSLRKDLLQAKAEIVCPLCPKSLPTWASVRFHLSYVHLGKPAQASTRASLSSCICPACGMSFQGWVGVELHLRELSLRDKLVEHVIDKATRVAFGIVGEK